MSEIVIFYVLGYFTSLGVFVFLVMKATKADFFPDLVLMLGAFTIIRMLISIG